MAYRVPQTTFSTWWRFSEPDEKKDTRPAGDERRGTMTERETGKNVEVICGKTAHEEC